MLKCEEGGGMFPYLLWDDEHGNQEQRDVNAAHVLGVFNEPYAAQEVHKIISPTAEKQAFLYHFTCTLSLLNICINQ